jgi:hypothetical protein
MNRYVKFPEMWVRTLKNRPTTAADWKVAIELLERAKFSSVVKFSNEATAKIGISPRTKWRSINRLEQWGLITINGRARAASRSTAGKSPRITVKWLAGRQPSDL